MPEKKLKFIDFFAGILSEEFDSAWNRRVMSV